MRWLPIIRWRDIDADEALQLGLEQAGRIVWQVREFTWFNFGIIYAARPKL